MLQQQGVNDINTINAQHFSNSNLSCFWFLLHHMAQKLASSVLGRLKKYRKLFDITCRNDVNRQLGSVTVTNNVVSKL